MPKIRSSSSTGNLSVEKCFSAIQHVPIGRGEMLNTAEIQKAQSPIAHEHVVAGMRIRVAVSGIEQSVPGHEHLPAELIAHRLVGIGRQEFLQPRPWKKFAGEYFPRGVLVVDTRHQDAFFGIKESPRLSHVLRLTNVVHFLPEHVLDGKAGTLHVFPLARQTHGKNQRHQVPKIGFDGARNAGILNLDGDFFSRFQCRTVNLSDGCGRKGLLVESCKQV